MAASTSESRAEVASSSSRIGASFSITRAMAMRWRWPPDSFNAALADLGVEAPAAFAIDQGIHEVLGLGAAQRMADLLVGGFGPSVEDVLADGAVEKRGVLRDHADLGAQRVLRHARDVLPVDQDAADWTS